MTTLIFNLRDREDATKVHAIVCNDWSAIDEHGTVQISSATGWVGNIAHLRCTIEEFIALIADGGKIVDVRHLQTEPP
jgi:hypothetical protein